MTTKEMNRALSRGSMANQRPMMDTTNPIAPTQRFFMVLYLKKRY